MKMPSAVQVKTLVNSHYTGDDEQFNTVALQIAASEARLSDMVLSESLETKLDRILLEQRNAERIEHNGLSPRRKLILVGPPGTGKTMTASALAGELGAAAFSDSP